MKIDKLEMTFISEHDSMEYQNNPSKKTLGLKLNEVINELNRINKILTPTNQRVISETVKVRILKLYSEGMSYRAIVMITGVSFSSVGRIIKKTKKVSKN